MVQVCSVRDATSADWSKKEHEKGDFSNLVLHPTYKLEVKWFSHIVFNKKGTTTWMFLCLDSCTPLTQCVLRVLQTDPDRAAKPRFGDEMTKDNLATKKWLRSAGPPGA